MYEIKLEKYLTGFSLQGVILEFLKSESRIAKVFLVNSAHALTLTVTGKKRYSLLINL